jgi:hypothetical protein
MRQADITGFLHFFQGSEETVKVGGHRGHAGFFQHRFVRPHPVGGVDVYRGCNPLTLVFGELLQRQGNGFVPVFFLCQGIEVAQRALLGPVLDVKAEHLHGCGRVAGGYAGTKCGHRRFTTATSHRHVIPFDALTFQIFLQNTQSSGFATRCPPMQDLYRFLCQNRRSKRNAHQTSNNRTLHGYLLVDAQQSC